MQTAIAKATSATVTTLSANRAGHKLTGLLHAALLGLILAAGLTGGHAALADPQPGAEQAGSPQTDQADKQTDKDKKSQDARPDNKDNGKDPDGKDNGKQDRRDRQESHAPTLTLTAQAPGSATLYPAAITVAASIVYPVDGDAHNKDASPEHRRNFEVDFLVNGVKFAEAERPPYQAHYTPPRAGHYSFTARLSYGEGHRTLLSNAVDAVSDLPPSVSLTAPAANTVITAPATFTLTANAASQIGSIARVDFYAATTTSGGTTNTLIGTATGSPYSYAWSSVPAGSYTLTAVATDSYGFSTTSTPVTVTVKPGELLPYYIHSDQLDTPRTITDTNANVVWQWDNSDPFGNNMANENPNGAGQFSFPLRFAGQYFDKETNLHYNVNRDYDPTIGRYIQSDPIGLLGGINTYTYVGGNPIRWIDPLGLWAGGFTFTVSTINPFTSGGGGTYGFNLEYTSSGGWGLYSLGTPNDVPSQGFIPGFSLTVNGATGTGDWSGPFDSTNGSYGLGTGGFFQSSPSPDPNPGYFGLEGGLSFGPPSTGSTTTNYTPIWLQNPPQAANCSQ